jgi:hypothetical protein
MYSKEGKLVAATWQRTGQRLVYQNASLKTAAANKDLLAADAIWQLTPTAATFSDLSKRTGRITREETADVYVLRYVNDQTHGTPRLLNATLTLRRENLHAIEQTLRVEERGQISNYRFTEAEYEQRPAAELSASIFEVDPQIDAVTAPALNAVRIQPALARATPDIHLKVLSCLDQANALLNELQIRFDAKGPLVIAGVVGTQDRKQEILAALGPLARNAAVRVAIQTADEVDQQPSGAPARLYVSTAEGSFFPRSLLYCSITCIASSRVGTRTSAPIPFPGSLSRRSITGIRKASVLPVPVCAVARTSLPVSAGGIAASWTGVGVVN